MNEATVQGAARLLASQNGFTLLRNNSGACVDQSGRQIRYGLGNDSARINKVLKSPDLVGVYPVTITPDMVGKTVGVFLGVECKPSDWTFRPTDPHATAQNNFHSMINRHGGVSLFCNDPDMLLSDIARLINAR